MKDNFLWHWNTCVPCMWMSNHNNCLYLNDRREPWKDFPKCVSLESTSLFMVHNNAFQHGPGNTLDIVMAPETSATIHQLLLVCFHPENEEKQWKLCELESYEFKGKRQLGICPSIAWRNGDIGWYRVIRYVLPMGEVRGQGLPYGQRTWDRERLKDLLYLKALMWILIYIFLIPYMWGTVYSPTFVDVTLVDGKQAFWDFLKPLEIRILVCCSPVFTPVSPQTLQT